MAENIAVNCVRIPTAIVFEADIRSVVFANRMATEVVVLKAGMRHTYQTPIYLKRRAHSPSASNAHDNRNQ